MYAQSKSIFARNASDILHCLSKLPSLTSKSHTVLFSVSPAPSWHEQSLTKLITHLMSLPRSLGCLSAPVRLRGDAKAPQAAHRNLDEYTLCSVAIFDSQVATSFRSTIPGREAPRVGRWHAFRKEVAAKLEDHQLPHTQVDWESVWAHKESHQELPAELQGLRPEDVSAVLYISDKAHEGLSNALEHFDSASMCGLLAHSTPFLTGRQHTLFHNQGIFSSGAVGLCLHRNSDFDITMAAAFPDLQPITPLLTISDSEGNLVHSIDDSNPSRLLLNAIAKLDSKAKDDAYYLGVYSTNKALLNSRPVQLYNIMSGDPSRGTLALEGDTAPISGTRVQIFRKLSGVRSIISPHNGLSFCNTYADGVDIILPQMTHSNDVIELDNTFLALSENGLIIRDPNPATLPIARAWKATIPGGACNFY